MATARGRLDLDSYDRNVEPSGSYGCDVAEGAAVLLEKGKAGPCRWTTDDMFEEVVHCLPQGECSHTHRQGPKLASDFSAHQSKKTCFVFVFPTTLTS